MSEFTKPAENLVKEGKTYIDLQFDELKLQTAKGLSVSVARILGMMLLIGLAITLLLILSFGVVLVLGDILHGYGVAAFIVGGVLALVLLILFLLRERLFRQSFVPLFINLFFPEKDE